MVCVEKRVTITEAEESSRKYAFSTPIVRCPYCNSFNAKKISSLSKAGFEKNT